MNSTSSKRRKYRVCVERLEARELLSSSKTKIPTGNVHLAASPLPLTLHLDQRSSPAGDYVAILKPMVSLSGQTAAGARVLLEHSTAKGKMVPVARTKANAQGQYSFHILCATGTTTMTVSARSAGGARSTASMSLTRGNQVVVWNSVALQMIRNVQAAPPDSARQLAILGVSVFDAVNAISPRYASYDISVNAPPTASADAAAASAAYTALVGLFPSQKPVLDAELATSLSAIPAGRAKAQGIALGTSVATQILADRANDGSATKVTYNPTPGPGVWVPTPPKYAPPIDPQWGLSTPFALTSGGQFQPPPPPAINSPEYAAAYNQVKAIGGVNSTVRTADQTAIAAFWSDQTGHTFDPPGHWNQIAEIVATGKNTNLENSARTFALLNIALADAGIASWNVKYTDNTWRPVTAIRAGDAGLNPLVTGDPTWTPLWPTPPFPSYVSGHSTFSAAAATVLDSIYGTNVTFTDPGDPTLDLTPRHFTGFDQAAQEAGMSRIYGGIHFSFDNTAGLALGTQVGNYVISHELAALKPN
jgi:PAP2 superfamily